MNCPHCSTVNPDYAESCTRCGTPLPIGESETILMVDATALPPGSDFGRRYRIEGLLGQGGMGRVYKAYDKDLDRTVALKVVRHGAMGETDALMRFKQELVLASKISHKNILRIHDMGEVGDVKFITMAYVEGQDLHGILHDNPKLPLDRILRYAVQLAEALAAAHAEGVVHRDLKPQNILVNKDDQIFVSDFGLAKSFEEGAQGMTKTGAFLGTPRYMSPEQVEGKPADQRSDLYAYGLMLYEMVTGDVPFTGESTLKVMYQRIQEKPKSPKLVNPSLPNWLVRIIMRCLEKDPAARYQSAYEILADLQGSKSSSGAPSVQIQIPEFARSRWTWLAGSIIGVVLLLVGAQIVLHRTHKTPTQHAPVSVLVADFANHTDDPVFDGTLEPMFNVALESASFINAYNRGSARKLAQKLPNPTDKLDEQPARLVALSQGVSTVIVGEISRSGNNYKVSAIALDTATGNVLAKSEATSTNKDEVVGTIPKLVAPIRNALGDTTPESVQLAASGPFTAASLEVVHLYNVGMEQQFAGKMEESLGSFSKAVELDPNFARAYAGMAATYGNLGQRQDSEKYIKLAMEHVDRMTERERYRIRGQYYFRTGNWQNCVAEYSEYLKQYPSDNVGQDIIAICFANLHNMPRAMEEAQRAVQIAPKDLIARMNLSLFACYSGDFQTCEREGREAQKLNPLLEECYLVLAYAQLGQGQLSQATEIYQKLQKVSERGAFLAASGLANLALYEGRYRQALQILDESVATDVAAKKPDRAADNFVMLSYAELLRGEKQPALAAAEKALANSQSTKIRFLAARTFVAAGETAKARKLAAILGSELRAEPQAYAKLIEGEAAMQEKHPSNAIQAFTDANKLLDTWIGWFDLGRAYLESGLFVEADSEFDRCLKRRGEALEFFDDGMPTYSYLPAVHYYQGRVLEGLKSPGFADPYRTYVSIRGQAGEDPLLPEIRKRIGQ
jgi:serine/threonine protein kinase/tetratricopeptide (TPR) repeat protein